MLSKKYNYDNYIEFGNEYSEFSVNGLINIYDILTIRKQLPDELLTQLKRKHIQSEFSFKNTVQDDEIKYVKPKTKEEIIQERIKAFEEMKKKEEETREKLLVSLKQAEISKQIRDNIEREDQIRKITYEFNDWLQALCEVVHISRILKYDTNDLIVTLNYVIDSIEEIDPKTTIQSNMFGFKGKRYDELLDMLSERFKKEVLEQAVDYEEEVEEDYDDYDDYDEDYDYESEDEVESEEDNVIVDDYNHNYDDDLGIYSVKHDKAKIWDSKRRKNNKLKSKKRFVNFRDKKKQDSLKGGNLDDRKKIFYYLVSRFDEIYDKHTDQNRQRIENILICEAYICMYNDDSYNNIELNDYKSHRVFDDVFENIVSIYAEKKDRKKKIYDRLFDENLYTYNLPYISRNNLLSLDHVKFIKEFNNRIKDRDKIKDYKKELYDRNKDRDDHFDKIVKIYKLYINTLDEGFIEKFSKELYDRNKDRDDQIDKIVEMYKFYKNTLDEEFIEKIKEEIYAIGKDRNNQIDKNVEMYKLYVNTLDEKFIEKIKKYDINFYNDGLSNLIRKNLTNMENYKKNSYILEVEGCNFNFLLNKLDVSCKYSFDVSHFYGKFIEVIKKTYKLTNFENKSKFYDECYIKLIEKYDSTNHEVLKNVIEHYANPKVFNADIDKYGNKIIQKLYTAFKKDTKGYNLIKDYLKERIEYWIQNTNFETYDSFFNYMKNYEKFTATLHNKMVTKLEKDHKKIKDLKTYFKLKIDQYKDNRFNEITKVKEKLTEIIKEIIPQCEFYIINYYVDEQLGDFKTDIGNRIRELITNYYTSLTADNFKIVNPNDEDSSTLNIAAFNDKDYGLNQQFYKNNDNKAKINLWKDFEDCYRKCVVDKLTKIAAELSFVDVTYILFVLSRVQLVDDSWINEILKTEKIKETIDDYLTRNLNSVEECITYLTTTINIGELPVLKYFFCIDKIATIIKKKCDSDPNFDFNQYETLIGNNDLSTDVREEIVKAMRNKLEDLFKRKLKDASIDDYIKEYDYHKKDGDYEIVLQEVVYNRLKEEIFVENDFEKIKKKFTELNNKYKDYFKFGMCGLYGEYANVINDHYSKLFELSREKNDNLENERIAREAISEFANWAESDGKDIVDEGIGGWYGELIEICGLDFDKLIDLSEDKLFVNHYNFVKQRYINAIGQAIWEDTLQDLVEKYNKITTIKTIDVSEIIEDFKTLYKNAFQKFKNNLKDLLINYKTYLIPDLKELIVSKIEDMLEDHKEDSKVVFNIIVENYSLKDYDNLRDSLFKLTTSIIKDEEQLETLNDWYIASQKEPRIQNAVKDEITSFGLTDNNVLGWYFDDTIEKKEPIKTLYQNIIKDNVKQLSEGAESLELEKIITLYEELNVFENIVGNKIKSNYRDVYDIIKTYDQQTEFKINQLFVTVLTSILKDETTPIETYNDLLNFISSIQ